MIDTIRLLTKAQPTDEQLAFYWRKHETEASGQVSVKYSFNRPKDAPHPFRATYRPLSLNGPHQLTIEFSLPKILLGKNWEMVWDIQGAVPYLNMIFADCPALSPLCSAARMTVSRLDVCFNHDVGANLTDYIEAFARLRFKHRVTVRFNNETTEFRDKSSKWKFYDKHAETKGEAPLGMLRQETTLIRSAAVKRALSSKKPLLYSDLTIPLLTGLLERNLQDLGLSERCLLAPPHVLELLTLEYGATRATSLFTYWTLSQTMSRAEIARHLGKSRNVINRHLADILKASIPLTCAPTDEPLPPLRITIPDPIPPLQCKICTQTPGITPGSLGDADGPEDLHDEAEGGDEDEA